jgi:pyruvate ferredoxin oxidoreductase gamma subunit
LLVSLEGGEKMTLSVAVDSKMLQITVWTRGVTLAKEARDTATLVAKAGKLEGKYTQSFDNYVDLPDRIGVPCKSYARLSPEPIETFYEYENYNPDIIILAEETMVKGHNFLKGAKPGCVVIINSARDPEKLLKWIEPKAALKLVKAIGVIDANSLGLGVTLTFDGTEGAGDSGSIGAGVGAVLAGAVAKVSGCVKLESVKKVAENKNAVQMGYDRVKIMPLREGKAK